MMKELIIKNRSYRRFHADVPVEEALLRELVDLARFSASGSNLQRLRYILSCDKDKNALIFPHLAWAGYLTDWPGPAESERPSAYIIILADITNGPYSGCDHGIAAQSILLGATEKGLGGCIIASVDRENLTKTLAIPPGHEILLAIALGKPNEQIIIDPVDDSGDIRYWRDDSGVHHVPKRRLGEIIIG